MKLISVVVITYGHENYIAQCLESIASQKGDFQLNIIVNNDASPDKTDEIILDIIEKYRNHKNIAFDYKCSESNLGMVRNFLDALSRVQGEYVTFCEGDDGWVDNQKIKHQLRFLENNNNYDIHFHDALLVNQNGQSIGVFSKHRSAIDGVEPGEIRVDCLIKSPLRAWHINTLLVRSDIIPKDLSWIYDHPLYDYVFQALLFSKGRNYYVPECWSFYRKHDLSVSTERPYDYSYYKHINKMLDDLKDHIDSQFYPSIKAKKAANLYFMVSHYSKVNPIASAMLFPPRLLLSHYSPYGLRDYVWALKNRVANSFAKK